jgi:hypothetical protein
MGILDGLAGMSIYILCLVNPLLWVPLYLYSLISEPPSQGNPDGLVGLSIDIHCLPLLWVPLMV